MGVFGVVVDKLRTTAMNVDSNLEFLGACEKRYWGGPSPLESWKMVISAECSTHTDLLAI